MAASLRPDTGIVILETPANPTLGLADIADVVRQAGTVPVLVDNTFATPILQNPARLGATLDLTSGYGRISDAGITDHVAFCKSQP